MMDFLPVWERIIKETELKKLVQLADFMGVSQQYVSKKKRENDFPIEWAFRIAQSYNLSTDWLLTGKGPRRRDDVVSRKEISNDLIAELDQWLSELLVKEPYRKDWFKGILEDAFPRFKKWKKRREGKESDDTHFSDENIA